MSDAHSILTVSNLTKQFGAFTAINDVTFDINEGRTYGIIGPNGAGKTTLLNCITGILEVTSGSVSLNGADITDEPPHEISHMGLSRSFQLNNLFEEFTVFENLRLAAQASIGENTNMWRNYLSFEKPQDVADELLDEIGLTDQRDVKAASLSHGEKRQLEVGLSLASDPEILLLDEPTAGLASNQIGTVEELISRLREKHTIILVEHNMDVIMGLSDEVLVLYRGELLSKGAPEEIKRDEQVLEAYLGTGDEI